MRAPIAIVGLVLLSGCTGPDDGETGAQPPAPGELVFEGAIALPGEQVAAEPNIIAADGGRVWVVSPGSLIERPNIHRSEVSLWYSEDHGATWEALRTPAPRPDQGNFCSCDADIDLGPDGVLYLTDFYTSPVGGFVVEASPDGGRTWAPGNFVTVTNLVGNDRQYINAGLVPGEVYLSYARGGLLGGPVPLPQPDEGLHLLRSTDGGRTFPQMSRPAPASLDTFPLIARPRIAPDGAIHFAWLEVPKSDGFEGAATVKLGTSRDDGATFDVVDVASVPNGGGGIWPLQIDVGPDGVVHVVWMERRDGGGSALWYTSSSDGGASFAPPRLVGWANGTALLPWIAHAGPGRAVVAFYGNPAAVEPKEAPADTRWDAWALVVDEGPSMPVRVSPWPVKVGTFCPEGASCPEDRELLDYPGIVWRKGMVYVAFAASILDEGAGPPQGPAAREARSDPPRGGHATAAHVYVARASLG